MTSWSPCSTCSISPCGSPLHLRGSWAYDIVYLPPNLERSIKIQKGALSLGIVLNAEIDKGINGCQVKSICSKKAIGRDGRVQVNDYIVKVNMESLRNVTNSQARAILKRTNLIGTQCNITYITASDAKIWKEKYHHEADYQFPVINRLSPNSFDSDVGGTEIPASSDASLAIERQSADISIAEKPIEKFVYNFVQAVLKDIWLELTSEHIAEVTNFDVSKKKWQPSLSELIETAPSTSVASQEIPRQLISSNGKVNYSESSRGKEGQVLVDSNISNQFISETEFGNRKAKLKEIDSEMDARRKGNNKESQEKSVTGMPSDQLNLPSETDQLLIRNEIRRNSLIEAELISPSMLLDSLPLPDSSETYLSTKSNRFKFWGQTRTVILHREPNQSFGISIVGGRVEVSHKSGQPDARNTVSGIFIKSVLPNSPAGLSNMMNMGDRVISVNDQDLREATHEQAVQVIKNAKNPVKFVVQSLHSFPLHQGGINEVKDGRKECDSAGLMSTFNASKVKTKDEVAPMMLADNIQELTGTEGTTLRKESSISVAQKIELQKSDELKFEEMKGYEINELRKKTSVSMHEEKPEGMQSMEKLSRKRSKKLIRRGIDTNSAAALPKRDDDPEEEDQFLYTKDKINRKYGNLLGDTILLKLDKIPRDGLGISLASNRGRDHDRMNVLVVAVKSTCPLSVKIGDELLEVNGKVLIGLSHLSASSIMRECCEDGILELLLLRRFETL
ncbi:unnamed protein product, partial [Acanthocheilonema viteae]